MTTNFGYTLNSPELPQPGTFYKVCKDDFPRLVCPRNCRLGSCQLCVKLKNIKPTFAAETILWKKLKDKHKNDMKLERQGYHARREKAINFPSTTGSIIIDWLTSKRMPHNAVSPKKWLLLKFPKFESCVIKNHGLRKFAVFPFLPVYSFDAMNISILYHHLSNWRSNFEFPEKLFIQVIFFIIKSKKFSCQCFLLVTLMKMSMLL